MPENWISDDLRDRPGLMARLMAIEPDRLVAMLVIGAVLSAAAVVGLVAATGQPIPIALVVGTIGGVMMLQFPMVALWIILVGVLLISGPLFMHMPALVKAGWLFSLLGFFLMLVSVLYPVLGKQRTPGRPPALITWMVLFMVAGLASMAYSAGGLDEGVTAVKRYFQYMGIAFLLATLPIPVKTIRRIVGLLGIMLVGHLIFSAYQRFWIVPQWEWLAGVRGFLPMDLVVGTFEGVLGAGGSSAVMAYSCLIGLVAVVAAWREKTMSGPTAVMWGLIALLPLGLGETRVIVLWLPLALMALNLDMIRKRPVAFVMGLMVAGVLTAGAAYVYGQLQVSDKRQLTFQERIDEAIAGNFGSSGYTGNDGSLNRTTVIGFWWEQHGLQNPIQTVFGHGLGSSFGGDGRGNGTGHLDQFHRGRGIALTGASTLLWDLGILGFGLYMSVLISATLAASRLARAAAPGFDRAMCRTLFAASVVMISMPVYTNMVFTVPSLEVLTALLLGMIAWRWRLGPQRDLFGDSGAAQRAQAGSSGIGGARAAGHGAFPLLPGKAVPASGRHPLMLPGRGGHPGQSADDHAFGRSAGRDPHA